MTEGKIKIYGLIEVEDECGEVCYQRLYDKEGGSAFFKVSNIKDWPEEAIIGRELFDAIDYIRAVRRGIKLAEQGYTNVSFQIDDVEKA